MFRTAEPPLKQVLNDIAVGKTQLPDFQRSWIWDDEHIKSLIASVSLAYPIGVMMFMDANESPFKHRLFFDVDSKNVKPKMLVLDGQQRLTAMYLALRSGKPVRIKPENKSDNIFRIYFLDMKKCLADDSDREEAVISVPAHTKKLNSGRKTNLDLSHRNSEYEHKLFPTALRLFTKNKIPPI